MIIEKSRLPVNSWLVEVEARKRGAIGEFEVFTVYTRAEPGDVDRYVIDDLHFEGYETRAVLSKLLLRGPK